MYIESIPNRDSPPAILLRESYRQDGKVRKRTLANLSALSAPVIEGLKILLRGGVAVSSPDETFVIERSLPHGHVAAVLGTARALGAQQWFATAPVAVQPLLLAMLVARVIEPVSKLATHRALHQDTATSSLGSVLGLEQCHADDLYRALDWLHEAQPRIEQRLARQHLAGSTLMLYDLSSTWLTGRCCELAAYGYSRDGKRDEPQIVFGLICNAKGCPISVQVFTGNTSDPATVAEQVNKLQQRFGIKRIAWVGDRGMLTSARIEQALKPAGMDWISSLRAPQIAQLLAEHEPLQFSLFDERNLMELRSERFPGERLVVCRNPLLAAERARKRQELLAATEEQLSKIAAATQRARRPLRDQQAIALRVGPIIERFHMAKHFELTITDTSLSWHRREEAIAAEALLDGLYVIRTSLSDTAMDAGGVVSAYKNLAHVERAFRSMKTMAMHVRPVFHYNSERVHAHVFLCMLAYYVQWHMRERLKPMLFDDEYLDEASSSRPSPVLKAVRSSHAKLKDSSRLADDQLPLHSFNTLLKDLATLNYNITHTRLNPEAKIVLATRPTALQDKAFRLLAVNPACTQ